MTPTPAASPRVEIQTSLGAFTVELDPDKAPVTVQNFLDYVNAGFFDGTIFHRVIPGFMVQGGGFEPGMKQKRTKAPIKNEASNGLSNTRGTLAMARTSDPNSATAQFFVNIVDNHFLDKSKARDNVGYCVFGKVVAGMDVVDKIVAVPTTTKSGQENVPQQDVVLQSARPAQA